MTKEYYTVYERQSLLNRFSLPTSLAAFASAILSRTPKWQTKKMNFARVCMCINMGERKKICVTQIKNLKVAQALTFLPRCLFNTPTYATIYAQAVCCCCCMYIVNVLSSSLLPSLATLIRVET